MENEQKRSVTFNGIEYDFNSLSKEVQNMVLMYNTWDRELNDAAVNYIKIQYALKALTQEISKSLEKKEVNPEDSEKNIARYTGTVRWFNPAKGFGYITPDGFEEDLFVHFSEINMHGFKALRDGQKVSFIIQNINNGKQATDVKIL